LGERNGDTHMEEAEQIKATVKDNRNQEGVRRGIQSLIGQI